MKNLRKIIGNIYKKANCNCFHIKNSRMNPLRGEKHNKYHEMNSDDKPELRKLLFWSNKSDSLKKSAPPAPPPCCDCAPPRRCWRGCCRPRTGSRASRPSPAVWRRWRSSSTRTRSVHWKSLEFSPPQVYAIYFPLGYKRKKHKVLLFLQGNKVLQMRWTTRMKRQSAHTHTYIHTSTKKK